jgi:hypothetical protein
MVNLSGTCAKSTAASYYHVGEYIVVYINRTRVSRSFPGSSIPGRRLGGRSTSKLLRGGHKTMMAAKTDGPCMAVVWSAWQRLNNTAVCGMRASGPVAASWVRREKMWLSTNSRSTGKKGTTMPCIFSSYILRRLIHKQKCLHMKSCQSFTKRSALLQR